MINQRPSPGGMLARPQQPQQAPPQQAQQRPPAPGPQSGPPSPNTEPGKQSGGAYPGSKDEVEKFVVGVIKSLHSDATRDGIMSQLTMKNIPVPARLATVAAQVINAMVIRVQQQAKRKPAFELLVNAIRMTVMEVARMAQLAGVKVSKEDIVQAGKMAGDMIDQTHSAAQGQQGQPQPAPMQPAPTAPGLLEQAPQQQGGIR